MLDWEADACAASLARPGLTCQKSRVISKLPIKGTQVKLPLLYSHPLAILTDACWRLGSYHQFEVFERCRIPWHHLENVKTLVEPFQAPAMTVLNISNDNLRSITQLISRLTVCRGTWLPLPSIPKLEAGVSWESPPTHFITHKNTGKNCFLVGKICYGRLFTCIYVTRIEILQSKASPGLAFTRLCICMYNLEESKQTQTVRLI